MGMTDGSWHYVCVLLDGNIGLLAVFKDGHRNFKEARRRAPNSEYWNAGNDCIIILEGGKQLKKNQRKSKSKKKKKKKIKYFKLIWKALVINHTHVTYLMHITRS